MFRNQNTEDTNYFPLFVGDCAFDKFVLFIYFFYVTLRIGAKQKVMSDDVWWGGWWQLNFRCGDYDYHTITYIIVIISSYISSVVADWLRRWRRKTKRSKPNMWSKQELRKEGWSLCYLGQARRGKVWADEGYLWKRFLCRRKENATICANIMAAVQNLIKQAYALDSDAQVQALDSFKVLAETELTSVILLMTPLEMKSSSFGMTLAFRLIRSSNYRVSYSLLLMVVPLLVLLFILLSPRAPRKMKTTELMKFELKKE